MKMSTGPFSMLYANVTWMSKMGCARRFLLILESLATEIHAARFPKRLPGLFLEEDHIEKYLIRMNKNNGKAQKYSIKNLRTCRLSFLFGASQTDPRHFARS